MSALALVASFLVLHGPVAQADGPQGASGVVGSFEIDGNSADDSGVGEPIDWETATPPTVSRVDFDDEFRSRTDDSFGQGSKQLAPGDWVCSAGGVPNKDDIVSGSIAVRRLADQQGVEDQFLYARWQRLATNGDAHIDYEINQSTQPNPACPKTPLRTDGDLLITFDTDQGGKTIDVGLFRWRFTGPGVGVFEPVLDPDTNDSLKHVTWDGAVNIPPEDSDPGVKAGAFGELSLNLTATLGRPIACGEFEAVWMKSRASSEENSALKDRTAVQPVELGRCPVSQLDKGVRNVTAGGTDFADTTDAQPGDRIEYQLEYTNAGTADATDVTITDELDPRETFDETFDSCTGGCTTADTDGDGNLELTWDLGTVNPGQTVAVTYQVDLDGVFPEGTSTVTNTAVVNTAEEEQETPSDETTVTVTAAGEFHVTKTATPDTVDLSDGDTSNDSVTVTISIQNAGNADASTDVVDDYDENHVSVSNISDGGMDDTPQPGMIMWSGIEVPVGQTVELTYTATFTGPFTDGEGTGGCDLGQFPVINTVTVTGDSASETVCVTASPAFEVTKTAADSSVNFGESTTYTITVTNTGQAPGGTTVTDNYDQSQASVSEIQPQPQTHDQVNGVITWQVTDLAPGDSAKFTYKATFDDSLSGEDPNNDCQPGQSAVINTVTVEDLTVSETVCVTGEPAFEVTKTASPTTAEVGDVITFTILVENVGTAPGSTTVFDDYDEDHLDVDENSIDPAGTHDPVNGTITWTSDELSTKGKNSKQTFTYTGTIIGTFSGDQGDCDPGSFPVVNTVSVEGDKDSSTVCVTAEPDLSVAKVADATDVVEGDTVTYTISYFNGGHADATNVVLRDDLGDATFVSCTGPTGTPGDCTRVSATQVRWNIGTVPAGTGGSVTVTVMVGDVGCALCDTARIFVGTTLHDEFTLCIDATPSPDPSGANANDSAFGAQATIKDLLGLLTLNTTLVPVESKQAGIGSDADNAQLLTASITNPLNLLGGGELLAADVLTTTSVSTVSEQPPAARHTSTSEAAGVDILNGLVTADLVRAVASTEATGGSAAFSSVGSTFVNLHIDTDLDGQVDDDEIFTDVAPNTRVDLPLLCSTCYVELYERVGSTTTPQPGQLSGGTYAADLEVNMIHVHVRDVLGNVVDVRVANAKAHSDFPQTELCEDQPVQAVSGHAFVLSALTDPSLAPVVVGYTSIPASGGFDRQNLAEAGVPEDGSVADAGVSVSETQGQLNPDSSEAAAYAETADVCLLRDPSGPCTVEATVVRAESNSSADAGGAASNDGDGDGDDDTIVAEVRVLGEVVAVDPAPNTVINLLGIGFLVLNEQFCDNNGTLANDCADGTVAGHAGRTVRAIRLVLLDPASGGLPGAEVIVAEAHSDATFVAP